MITIIKEIRFRLLSEFSHFLFTNLAAEEKKDLITLFPSPFGVLSFLMKYSASEEAYEYTSLFPSPFGVLSFLIQHTKHS